MKLARRNPDVILLIDGSKESEVARTLLEERGTHFAVVDHDSIERPGAKYVLPTLFVRGDVYSGLREVKRCLNGNLHL